jgi:hypothetical protein
VPPFFPERPAFDPFDPEDRLGEADREPPDDLPGDADRDDPDDRPGEADREPPDDLPGEAERDGPDDRPGEADGEPPDDLPGEADRDGPLERPGDADVPPRRAGAVPRSAVEGLRVGAGRTAFPVSRPERDDPVLRAEESGAAPAVVFRRCGLTGVVDARDRLCVGRVGAVTRRSRVVVLRRSAELRGSEDRSSRVAFDERVPSSVLWIR